MENSDPGSILSIYVEGGTLLKVLVIGSGGREHALAWQLHRHGHQVFAAPGNPGIAEIGSVFPSTNYLEVANSVDPDLTIVGPELPLVEGVVDAFRAAGRAIVGPTAANAQLEASKIFSKSFMRDCGIPTARSEHVDSVEAGLAALPSFSFPVVVKADGLAAGKGVIIAHDPSSARTAIRHLGPRLLLEEFLVGEEVSLIALCDGKTAIPLDASQDHKSLQDNDWGPNTGGMGAYCDGRILTADQIETLLATIIAPVVDRTQFTGFLYAGLMMTADGPKVLEFNVRLGDPETQCLMHRLDSDFAQILQAAAHGQLAGNQFSWKKDPSVCVVMAAHGYPGNVRVGDTIHGIDQTNATVFQAGTERTASGLQTAGGRVLGVTDSGPDLKSAIANTYNAVSQIQFEGMQYRQDIAQKGLRRWGNM